MKQKIRQSAPSHSNVTTPNKNLGSDSKKYAQNSRTNIRKGSVESNKRNQNLTNSFNTNIPNL